ncbi:MAG TPA: 3'(2'),5'-bisphosphate nucleotidase CysQ [Pyrinomonadaceae bacterium]|nr:3'(2'),5'-bisphosphate nucleotidase CysQ [Pyrinomonadaceae bacterium]
MMEQLANAETYHDELQLALCLAKEAGAAIMSFYNGPLHIEQKKDAHDYEPVTQADMIANDIIVRGLARAFPDDGILAEESLDTSRRLRKDRVWMVDPLDGTNGFIDGNGDFAVQIGLAEGGACVMGVVYQPVTGSVYHAVRGGGSWIQLGDSPPRRAQVSTNDDLQKMTLAASRSHRSPRMDQVVRALGVTREVRRGSVGVKVGLIIEQQCDLYVHLSPRTKQWDTCAPDIILKEAGGRLTDLFGAELRYNDAEVQNRNGLVASNGLVHAETLSTLSPVLEAFGRVPV